MPSAGTADHANDHATVGIGTATGTTATGTATEVASDVAGPDADEIAAEGCRCGEERCESGQAREVHPPPAASRCCHRRWSSVSERHCRHRLLFFTSVCKCLGTYWYMYVCFSLLTIAQHSARETRDPADRPADATL